MFQTETADALKIHFIFITFFFSENFKLCETMWRNMMDSNNITWRMRIACRVTKAKIRTLRIGNICFFSSWTIVRRTRPNIMVYVGCLSYPTLTMSHHKYNIAYGCCQLDSIFLWFPNLYTHRIGDGLVIESYKHSRKFG